MPRLMRYHYAAMPRRHYGAMSLMRFATLFRFRRRHDAAVLRRADHAATPFCCCLLIRDTDI